MLREIPLSEMGTWAALWRIDPWDQERADLRTGIVASIIANVHRDSKRKVSPFEPRDFMPYVLQDEQAKQADLSRRLRAALNAAGAMAKLKRRT